MLLVTTPNRQCVRTYLTESKQVVRVEALDNGQHVKRRCLPSSIKQKVEDINRDQVRKTYVVCSQSKKVQLQYL